MRALAVCGARGGVGTTTIAVGVARALHGLGEPCVLMDLDPTGPATAALAPPDGRGGPSLGAALVGRWAGPAGELLRATTAGPGLVPAVGLGDVGAILSPGAQARLKALIATLAGDEGWVVLDCPAGPASRVSPFTAAALTAVAELGAPRGGLLAVMSPAAPDIGGTAALLGRVPPEVVLGLVCNRVADSVIEASRHDVGRRLNAPVLARIHAVDPLGGRGAIDAAVGGLVDLLRSPHGLAEARAAVQTAIESSGRRDAELVRLLHTELSRLARDPDAELDCEFGLGLELLRGTHVHDRLSKRHDELVRRRDEDEARRPSAESPSRPADATLHDRIHRLAPWAAGQQDPTAG